MGETSANQIERPLQCIASPLSIILNMSENGIAVENYSQHVRWEKLGRQIDIEMASSQNEKIKQRNKIKETNRIK